MEPIEQQKAYIRSIRARLLIMKKQVLDLQEEVYYGQQRLAEMQKTGHVDAAAQWHDEQRRLKERTV